MCRSMLLFIAMVDGGTMWCEKRKMDAAQIFDLGDGPSGRSGYLYPKKFSSAQIWFNSLMWLLMSECTAVVQYVFEIEVYNYKKVGISSSSLYAPSTILM